MGIQWKHNGNIIEYDGNMQMYMYNGNVFLGMCGNVRRISWEYKSNRNVPARKGKSWE